MGLTAIWAERHPELHHYLKTMGTILAPAALIFLLGVYDDLRGVGVYFKFAVQAIAAVMLYAGGLRIVNIPVLLGDRALPSYIGLVLTVLWVLAITNAFNLIDGLDGLAAGSALFSTIVMFVVAVLNGPALVDRHDHRARRRDPRVPPLQLQSRDDLSGRLRQPVHRIPAQCSRPDGAQKAPTIVAVAIPVVSFGLPILETSLSIVRRLISGRPVFTADREHIHHKLLQHGMSHRQVVIILYGVSAIFAMLSLFLLWPTGSSLGLVLAVIGIGIWIGVQHLGYLEFGELARVAHRTLDQPQIFVNNLAIRRATEELKVARDFDQVRRILLAAFGSNDFDAFDLALDLLPGAIVLVRDEPSVRRVASAFHWSKPGARDLDGSAVWTITLDLLSSSNRHCGTLTIHRFYSSRNLQVDVNLLTSQFPVALADALDRTLSQAAEVIAIPALLNAQAG